MTEFLLTFAQQNAPLVGLFLLWRIDRRVSAIEQHVFKEVRD